MTDLSRRRSLRTVCALAALPLAITATARTRCPATGRPAGVGRNIRATDNPTMKTVIQNDRHSLFVASIALFPGE